MGIMKKNLLTAFALMGLSTISPAKAYDAIVIVLEAPLLREPALNSQVVQLKRKGERVYIPNEEVIDGVLPEFVPTYDRTGNRAYVPSKYIKVVLGTTDENKSPIKLAGHDPTDYRIEEPIPETYPFDNRKNSRASLAASLGTNSKSPYSYNSEFSTQKYGVETGGRLMLTTRVSYDRYDRFFFGLVGFITTAKNEIQFKNNYLAKESRDAIRLGPWLTYDAFKNEKYRLTIGTGFTFNFHRSSIFIDGPVDGEERLFSGFSLSPMTSTLFQARSFLPGIDFIGGVDMTLFLPYSMKTNDDMNYPNLWNGDQINNGLKIQASAFLGLQTTY